MPEAYEKAKRDEWITGLRELADFMDETPEFPLPGIGRFDVFLYPTAGRPVKETMAENVRRLGRGEKGTSGGHFYVRRRFGPHLLDVNAPQDEVCERVVTGSEDVEVPDPDAPSVIIARDIVEWVCPDSILAAGVR